MIALLLFLACAHKDEPVKPSAVETAAAAQSMAPTPYTAAQIRDAMPVGTTVVYRRVEANSEPYLNRMTIVSADAVTCKIADAIVDEQGNVITEEGETEASWEELRKHGEFPVSAVQMSDDAVDVPAGHFDTSKYVVTEPDGTVTTYQFAKKLPGPPVWMEVRAHEAVVFSMQLVSRTGL
jgi:hypothetical protein